jgi:predicted transcriptional regulator
MTRDISPAARALVALELIQNNPGITALRLADRLGVTERAARRYVRPCGRPTCRSSRSAVPMAATGLAGACGCPR